MVPGWRGVAGGVLGLDLLAEGPAALSTVRGCSADRDAAYNATGVHVVDGDHADRKNSESAGDRGGGDNLANDGHFPQSLSSFLTA